MSAKKKSGTPARTAATTPATPLRHQAEVERLISEFGGTAVASPNLPGLPVLQAVMMYVADELTDFMQKSKFFHAVAQAHPLDFLICLFFPFVEQKANPPKGATYAPPTPDDIKLLESAIKAAVEAACKELPDGKKRLMHYFQSFAPYAVHKYGAHESAIGEKATPWAESKIWAKAALKVILEHLAEKIGQKHSLIKFADLWRVEQAYWTAREAPHHEKLDVHPTIRVNALPFAESAILHRMDRLAHEHGINLELVEVPWDKVGLALLTNRIDAAFYSEAIRKQLDHLKHAMDGRILFGTEQFAMDYNCYYILQRPSLSGNEPRKVAYVANSDHEVVLHQLFSIPSTAAKTKLTAAGLPSNLAAGEKLMCPVANPDDALEAVVNGDGLVTHCLVGGIHHQYAASRLKHRIEETKTIKITANSFQTPTGGQNTLPTRLRFFTVARSNNEASEVLQPLAALWSTFKQDWSQLSNGLEADPDLVKDRDGCVAHVNRDPRKAFVSGWNELQDLIAKHNDFHSDLGNIVKVSIP